jgi:formylglycine-generating enzyme required for sulfatase activity
VWGTLVCVLLAVGCARRDPLAPGGPEGGGRRALAPLLKIRGIEASEIDSVVVTVVMATPDSSFVTVWGNDFSATPDFADTIYVPESAEGIVITAIVRSDGYVTGLGQDSIDDMFFYHGEPFVMDVSRKDYAPAIVASHEQITLTIHDTAAIDWHVVAKEVSTGDTAFDTTYLTVPAVTTREWHLPGMARGEFIEGSAGTPVVAPGQPGTFYSAIVRITDTLGNVSADTVAITVVLGRIDSVAVSLQGPFVNRRWRENIVGWHELGHSIGVGETGTLKGVAIDSVVGGTWVRCFWRVENPTTGEAVTVFDTSFDSSTVTFPDQTTGQGRYRCVFAAFDDDGNRAGDTVTLIVLAPGGAADVTGGQRIVEGGKYAYPVQIRDYEYNHQGVMVSDQWIVDTAFVTRTFAIDTVEVTQGEFSSLMGGYNPSSNAGDDHPVENPTWYDAVLFCNARSVRDGFEPCYSYGDSTIDAEGHCTELTDIACDFRKNGYRLPTLDEWQIAARAGRGEDDTLTYQWGNQADSDSADRYCWYQGNAIGTRPVATKQPNAYGLYDMQGNVAEWCWNFRDPDNQRIRYDYTGPEADDYRYVLGGSYRSDINQLNHNRLETHFPHVDREWIGFRTVRTVP